MTILVIAERPPKIKAATLNTIGGAKNWWRHPFLVAGVACTVLPNKQPSARVSTPSKLPTPPLSRPDSGNLAALVSAHAASYSHILARQHFGKN